MEDLPKTTPPSLSITFNDPRLRMTVAGRLFIRVVTWITYLVLIAGTFTFLISSILRFRFAGVFLALVLVDLLVHRGEADVPIVELSEAGVVNVAETMRPAAFSTLGRAFDASVITRRDLFLEIAKRLLEFPEIENALQRMDIPIKEFKQKLGEVLVEKLPAPPTREEYAKQAESLAVHAFGRAVASGHNFIEVSDLFAALPEMGDEATNRLFSLFSVDPGDVERALIFGSGARAHGWAKLPEMLSGFTLDAHRVVRHRIMNRAWTSRPTPMLDKYGEDLTDLARDGEIGFLIGHADEYERLVTTLARPTNPNALLVGDVGIGK